MTKLFNLQWRNQCGLLTLVLFGLLCSAGCPGGDSAKAKLREGSSLKPIAVLYGQYIGQHRGSAPKTAEAFRKFVEDQGTPILDTFAVENVDQLFISERDGEPFVIHYASKGKIQGDNSEYIACEKVGVDGKHFAATALGKIDEIPTEELSHLLGSE